MAITIDPKIDLSLVRQAQAGDAGSFGQLYDFYIKKIYDFVFYKTLNKEAAEDITSIVFVKVWKNINQFKQENFSAWLYSIARNSVVDYYRRSKENMDIEDCWDLADKNNFLEQVDANLKIEAIKDAMKNLGVAQREIIIMRFWLDLSFEEIAARLGKNEGAVKMALGRALKDLKNKIPLALIILGPGAINICRKMS